MSKYALCHNAAKHAIAKDGWLITEEHFAINYGGLRLYADLGAEKQQCKIVVETKAFSTPCVITDLETVIGEYVICRTLLGQVNPERELYLAIAQNIYEDLFQQPLIQDVISDQGICLLVFDPNTEEILQWIG